MCIINSIFYSKLDDTNNIIIKKYINNLQKINTKSKIGNAFFVDFLKSSEMFIVKTPKSIDDDNLEHELIVGLYGTNTLRQYIPNFAYIYGGFKCSGPILNDNNKVVDWCVNNNYSVNYILYENINPSISLETYLETCTSKEYLNIFLQIIYSLRMANKMIDFTHYDLHTGNILIRDINIEKFQIQYDTENGVEYITTDLIATFIDFGMSHIYNEDLIIAGDHIENGHYGVYNFLYYDVYPNKSWIMSDIYKVLLYSALVSMNANNNDVIIVISNIYKFFNKDDNLRTAVITQKDHFYNLPITTEAYENFTIDKLTTYIRSIYQCDFISNIKSKDPVLNCENLSCLSTKEVYENVKLL
jgi:hypothetical protein